MIIGNVIYDGKMPFEYDFIKKYKHEENVGMDKTIPTLYVGYLKTKRALGKFNPLDRTISDKVSWTYEPVEENRTFERDFLEFTINCCKTFVSDYEYHHISLYEKNTRDYYIRLLLENSNKIKILFTKTDSIYIVLDKSIYSFSYKSLKFIGIDCRRLFSTLKKRGYNVYTEKDVSNEGKTISLFLDDERWLSLFI